MKPKRWGSWALRLLPVVGVTGLQIAINGWGVLSSILVTLVVCIPAFMLIAQWVDHRIDRHKPRDASVSFIAFLNVPAIRSGHELKRDVGMIKTGLRTYLMWRNLLKGYIDVLDEGLRWRPSPRVREIALARPFTMMWDSVTEIALEAPFGRIGPLGIMRISLADDSRLECEVQRPYHLQEVLASTPLRSRVKQSTL